MNNGCKERVRMVVTVRVAMVALVLLCIAPHKLEAETPALIEGDGALSSAALSAEDWSAIQASLAQATGYAPLVAGQVAKLTASDAAELDYFGFSVAADGDTVVVGAWGEDGGPGDPLLYAGAAYVFERNQGGPDNWGQVQKLTASDATAGDVFGSSVAISEGTVVVGAYGEDGGSGDPRSNAGAAYVFERNQGGPDNWGEVQRLAASDAAADDQFGHAVAVSGDTVVVGAPRDDDACPLDVDCDSGSAYVFERNQGGADNWGRVQKLTASDAAAGDWFGQSVAISGDTIVVGAHLEGEGGSARGSAYVFERNQGGADNWGQVEKLTASDAAAGDSFGWSVTVSGDTVVVGALGEDEGGNGSGAAYVFERNQGGADNWGQVRKLTAGDAAASDRFGDAVSISGDTVVVGAAGDDSNTGAAYVFERNQGGADNWGQVQKLAAGDAAAGDDFGCAVAVSGNTVVAGAVGEDGGPGDPLFAAGAAYVFALRGAAWTQQQKPVAGDGAAGDLLGTSVAVSGDILIGGAPGEADDGAAYLFYRNEDGADQWGQARKKPGPGTSGAEFGQSVAIDVDTAVVGAPGADQANIVERNDSGADQWGHVKTLSGAGGSEFGRSVSISGDTAVVGAPSDDTACFNCGAAYVYERNYDPGNPSTPLADNWGLRAVLTATVGPEDGDQFGWSVAISGDTVVVGARHDTHSGETQAGSVYVFKRNYDGYPGVSTAENWGLVRNLRAGDAAAYDWFGHAVGISGDQFVVGAPGDDSNTGAAYVFERNHVGWEDWGQVEKLTAGDGEESDHFGHAVAISGDTVVVGAYGEDGRPGDPLSDSGAAYVFERDQGGADNWGQMQKLTADDAAEEDWFGWSVSISGNTVVVGAPYDDDGGDSSGSTYVFRWGAAAVYLPLVLKN